MCMQHGQLEMLTNIHRVSKGGVGAVLNLNVPEYG